jgi:hypothetical protein
MKQLNEAVIKLINQDVVSGKKLIENELYQRLGSILEEKLVGYAPTIFEKKGKDLTGDGKVDSADWKEARNQAIKKKMQKESAEMISEEDGDEDEDILSEEYENMVDDLQRLIESIEEENGEELTEAEIQELAEMLLEEYESENEEEDEDEEDQDEEEDFEEDSDEDE